MAAAHAFVSRVVDMLFSDNRQEFRLLFGVGQNLARITSELIDAERRQWKEENVHTWLHGLKILAYEVDDVIDEMEYERFRGRIIRRKVWSFNLLHAFYLFLPSVFSRDHLNARKIRDLDVRLGHIVSEGASFHFESLRNYEHIQYNTITFGINISAVKGIDENSLSLERDEPLHSIRMPEKGVEQNIFDLLWLRYNDLPSPLRQCLSYCAIFPKGYRMSKDELIGLWMAHGFLKPTKGRDMEMVGNDIFHILFVRSFFQEFEAVETFNGFKKTYFKMDDTVHDFFCYIMRKECLCCDLIGFVDVIGRGSAYRGLYHLYGKLGEKVSLLDSYYYLRKLRSLIVLPPKNYSSVGAKLPNLFNELTCLRSLSLSRCGLQNIPSSINKLVHLRWLKLSKNYALKELPETICELYNLQTLSVNWCTGLIRFPKGVENLTNLRHLKNDHTYFLLPKWIRKLWDIRKLPRITIDPKSKDSFSLRDLKSLNNIDGSLTIFVVERKQNRLVKDASEALLSEKKHITALSLNFPERAAEKWMQREDEELVEALKPPPSLKMLRITSYKGTNCPSWIITFTSLKIIKLWYWSNCEHLPALANLPCLENVEFNHFGRVKKVAAEFYWVDGVIEASTSTSPLFPKLKNLQLMNMVEWEEWHDYEGDEEVMPCLSFLSIENCPKLKQLPSFISKKDALHKLIS